MYDIAIIGAGPGGYAAAIRAARLGAKVALIERENVGGVCLNRGCIPSKTVIACVEKYNEAQKLAKFGVNAENLTYNYGEIYNKKQKTVDKLQKSLTNLIKANKIELINAEARIESANLIYAGSEKIEFKYLVIATGSAPAPVGGLEIDHGFVLDSDDVLALRELPDSVLIVGSGAIGIEWARIFHGLKKQAGIVEIADRLCPMYDREVSGYVEKLKRRMRIPVYKNTVIEKLEGKKAILSNGVGIEPGVIFIAAGRQPNTGIKGIENLNIEKNGKFLKVDNNLKTNINNIYAIGDVTGLFPLAHVASRQGVKAVEHIMLGKQAHINYCLVPNIIYGKPEVASVGYTEDALAEKGMTYKKSIFPVSATGRAQADDKTEGFVKVLADENEILGVHIVAECAGELIQQANIAMNRGNLKEAIFPHPTYSEAFHEAFLGISGECLHI